MTKKSAHREAHAGTPATAMLKAHGVAFEIRTYDWIEHGGAQHSAQVLQYNPHAVIKTIILQNQDRQPLIMLMHGDRKIGLKDLARQIGARGVEKCAPEIAHKHSGYLVGGTSPFGTKKIMPVFIEKTIADFDKILINGGRRGFLVEIDPQVCFDLLHAQPVQCAQPL